MAKFKNRKITVLVPAHNEEDQISETVLSLKEQTHKPDNVVVIADNCNDQTVEICKGFSFVEIFITVNNKKKKAGALNQWLDKFLDTICDEDLLMVMDADSTLDQKFIENALPYIERGFSACGGVFTGKIGGGIVGSFQRNEYARYERDIRRKDGATLVLTGTATIFLASALKDVVTARSVGKLPCIDGEAHVYDTGALTEDNELTFALLHLDHAIIAPAECALKNRSHDNLEIIRTTAFALETRSYREQYSIWLHKNNFKVLGTPSLGTTRYICYSHISFKHSIRNCD